MAAGRVQQAWFSSLCAALLGLKNSRLKRKRAEEPLGAILKALGDLPGPFFDEFSKFFQMNLQRFLDDFRINFLMENPCMIDFWFFDRSLPRNLCQNSRTKSSKGSLQPYLQLPLFFVEVLGKSPGPFFDEFSMLFSIRDCADCWTIFVSIVGFCDGSLPRKPCQNSRTKSSKGSL